MANSFEEGVLLGLLIGEGHFGGDGRQPQVTLRMHVRHQALFEWIEGAFPGGRLYGPYNHDGRRYFQWMARGAYLRDELVPLLERGLSPDLDGHSWERFLRMRTTYTRQLGPAPSSRPVGVAADQPDGVGQPDPGRAPGGETTAERAAVIFERLRRTAPADEPG